VTIGGLAVVSTDRISGITIGGLAVVAPDGPIRWVCGSLGAVVSEDLVEGIAVAGYGVRSPNIRGVAISALTTRSKDFRGLGIAGYNDIRGTQTGITIGLINRAKILKGVQIGLLNYAENNPAPFRILPILNLNLRRK
jgi:hypothetical protein